MEVTLCTFRDGGAQPCRAVWSELNRTWMCGDEFGNIHQISNNVEATSTTIFDSPLSVLALSPTTSACALGTEESVRFSEFPNISADLQPNAIRRTLNITALEYDHSGSYL